MNYLAIMNWNGAGRGPKYQEFATEAEAAALVARGGVLPGTAAGAYVAPHPGGTSIDWLCDPIAKTVAVSPLPVPELTLAQKLARYEAPGVIARKIEDLAVERLGAGAVYPQAFKDWVNARRAQRGEPPL